MNEDDENMRRVLMGIAATVRQSVALSAKYGDPSQKEFVKEAAEYVGRQMNSDPICDPVTANHYIDELRKLIEVWKEKEPNPQRIVTYRYVRDNFVNTTGRQMAQGSITVEGGASDTDIVEACIMFQEQVKAAFPEIYANMQRNIDTLTQLVENIDMSACKGMTISETIDYIRGRIQSAIAKLGSIHLDTDNEVLTEIWRDVLATFDKIPNPDDLDKSVYKRLLHLIEETGSEPTQEDIDKMLPDIEELHEILKRSL